MTLNPDLVASIINTKLRDYYNDLDSLLDDLDNAEEMINILMENDYLYIKEINQFRKK